MKPFISHTPFSVLTRHSDGLASSRLGALFYIYLSNFIANMVTTTYFVGLMLEMGANENYISAITVTITVCGFLQFLSPLLLERMPKRKGFLMAMRAAYHFLYIVVIAAIPLLPLEKNLMLGAFMTVVIVANAINALSLSGMSIWHIQNIPDKMQSDFFTLSNVGSQALNALTGFLASRVVDIFQEENISVGNISPLMWAFIVLRLVALLCAVGEIGCLVKIKEHPYRTETSDDKKEKIGIRTLLLPLTDRAFMKTILIYTLYFFIAALIGRYFEIYLLDVVHMSYTYKSLSGIVSLPIVLLLSPLWSFLLRKLSWNKIMPIALVGVAIGYFFNTLITSETQVFHIFCLVFYSSFYAAVAIIFAFLPYINMPETNRTAYISFFTISGSVASLLGNLAGILFMNCSSGLEYKLFGLTITNYQTLNLIQTVLILLLALYSAVVARTKTADKS